MKLKVHFPDCSKAVSLAKEYGGVAGSGLGKGVGFAIGWSVVAIAVASVFTGFFAFKAMASIAAALLDVMDTAGRFAKSGIAVLSGSNNASYQSEISDSDLSNRLWRRSA